MTSVRGTYNLLELARELGLGERIEMRQQSVYDLAHAVGRYDIVMFLGVLYHLRHPLLALDVLRRVTRRRLIVQTLTMPGEGALEPPESIGLFDRDIMLRPGWPRMAFIERSLEDDPTNWWAPDDACVEAMLRAAGFEVAARPGHEIYVCAPLANEPAVPAALRAAELHAIFEIPGEPP